VATFFYDKKYIIKAILPLPKFLNEGRLGFKFLKNNINYKPAKLTSPHGKNYKLTLNYGTQDQIKFILKNLRKFKISKRLSSVLKKKVIVVGIKNFSLIKKVNENINFQVRQTRDLDKVYKLINYIKNQNIKVVILGKNKDNFIKIIKNKNIIDNKKVFLFKDLSKNYSIADQVYLAEKSMGFVGNYSGSDVFFQMLKKKIINVDMVKWEYLKLWENNRKYVFKYVINKKNKIKSILDIHKHYTNNEHIIQECSYRELVVATKKHLKI
jgi:hypothetical protein